MSIHFMDNKLASVTASVLAASLRHTSLILQKKQNTADK